MDLIQWAAIGTIVAGFGGILIKLFSDRLAVADRLTNTEAKAEFAAKSVISLDKSVDALESTLVQHRVAVAEEYVSRKALEALESKLIEAINRLGDRLDRAFQRAE